MGALQDTYEEMGNLEKSFKKLITHKETFLNQPFNSLCQDYLTLLEGKESSKNKPGLKKILEETQLKFKDYPEIQDNIKETNKHIEQAETFCKEVLVIEN
jgi:hypothetical protein